MSEIIRRTRPSEISNPGLPSLAKIFVDSTDSDKLKLKLENGNLKEVVFTDSDVLSKEPTETLTANNVITAEKSGTTFFLNDAEEFVSILPAPAEGLRFKFVVTGAPSEGSYTVVTDSSANIIQGTVIVNGASVAGRDGSTITFPDGSAFVGDWVEVISDGINWYINGVGQGANSITIASTKEVIRS